MEIPEFKEFPKIPRLSRECCVNLKIDGTNAQIYIDDYGVIWVGSRNKWITPQDDNYGFARWVEGNKTEVLKLGPGQHFMEWAGSGIQRGYGLKEKRAYLFNNLRWIYSEEKRTDKKQMVAPTCFRIAPMLSRGIFTTDLVEKTLSELIKNGEQTEFPGWEGEKHEGVIVWHIAGQLAFKKTIKNDSEPKGLVK